MSLAITVKEAFPLLVVATGKSFYNICWQGETLFRHLNHFENMNHYENTNHSEDVKHFGNPHYFAWDAGESVKVLCQSSKPPL